jgi:hypothetical protein
VFVTDSPISNSTEPMLLFYPGYSVTMPTAAQHCNYDGDDCWTVRVHPKISSVSENSGFVDGGQFLTIDGFGLNGTDVTVLVDGVEC